MEIPTERELAGPKPYCLDTERMLEDFLGKTREDAIKVFENTGGASEDFSYMSGVGLRFYLEVALEYLKSDAVADEEWGFPDGLLCSLMCQVKYCDVDRAVIPLIKDVAEYCRNHTQKLDLDEGSKLYQGYIRSIEEAEQDAGERRLSL